MFVKILKYLCMFIWLLVDSKPSSDNNPNTYVPFNSMRSDEWSSNPLMYSSYMPKNALICPYMPNPQNHKSNNKDLTCHPRTSLKHRTLMPPLTTLKNLLIFLLWHHHCKLDPKLNQYYSFPLQMRSQRYVLLPP